MSRCNLKKWTIIGIMVVLGMLSCRGLTLANEPQQTLNGSPSFESPYNTFLDSFFLNFSQRYYRAVESSLQEKSYFAFRYYVNSPFESFDKRQFISENPTQANELASNALHNVIRKTVEDIEILTIIRDYAYALTSLQVQVGSKGAQLRGPSLTGLSLENSAAGVHTNKGFTFKSGLTFADDLRLGLKWEMGYRMITSKLSYYPTSRNQVGYTAETQLTASSKIGMSYQMSQDSRSVVTTLSLLF